MMMEEEEENYQELEFEKRHRQRRGKTRGGRESVRDGAERFGARVRGRRERSVPVREDVRFDETKSSDSERGGENGGGKI